ncbi:MAG: glycosyltransferase family 4 protein, partial [Acidobacteriota bacterium]
MKIAVLSRVAHPLHGIGGLERHVGALVRHLVRAGEEVTLYTAPADEKRARLAGAHLEVVPYRLLPWPRRRGFVVADRNTNYLVWSLRVGRKVAASTVDIVQAEAAGGFGYAWLRTPGAAPLVLHPHGMEEFKSGLVKKTAYLPLRLAVRYAARRAERVLVPDGAMEKEVEGYLSVDPKRMVVLPNAVDLEEIDRPV